MSESAPSREVKSFDQFDEGGPVNPEQLIAVLEDYAQGPSRINPRFVTELIKKANPDSAQMDKIKSALTMGYERQLGLEENGAKAPLASDEWKQVADSI